MWSISDGATESNWALDADGVTPTSLVPGVDTLVHFSASNATVPATMTLGADMKIWGIAVDDASNVNLTADGKSLTIAGTDVDGGIVVANAGGTLSIACPVVLGSVQTWTNDSVNDLTVSGAVSSALAMDLTKAGSGVLALNGPNSYSGATLLTAGTLKLGNVNALAGSTLDVTSSGTLVNFAVAGSNTYNVGGLKGAQDLALGGNTLSVGANNAATAYSGALASTGGGLTKVGTGTLTLDGATSNTHTGTTTVYQGVLALGKSAGATAIGGNLTFDNNLSPDVYTTVNNQFAPGTVVSFVTDAGDHGRLELLGTTQTVAGIQTVGYTTQRGVIQNREMGPANTGNSTLVLDGSGSYTFGGYLRNQNGTLALTKSGSGTQTLVGGAITYTGATTVSAGLLKLTDTTGFNSPITNSATVEFNATGSILLGGSAALSGAGTYNKTGAGTLQVNGAQAISATGQINVQTGTLQNGGNVVNWSPNKADIDVSATAILDLFADPIYADALTGAGFVQNNYGNTAGLASGAAAYYEKLVLGTNNGSGLFSGVIRNNSAGTVPAAATAGGGVDLVKTGTGTQELSGANTYTGVTTVNGGTLTISGAAGTINASSNVTLAGGTLELANSAAANNGDRLKDAGTITMNGGTLGFANSGGAANFSESAGALSVAVGSNTVSASQADVTQTSTLTLASLAHTAGASVDFVGVGLGVDDRNKIMITANPPLVNGIIGTWATYNGGGWAAYDVNLGVTDFAGYDELTRLSSGTKVIADNAASNARIVEGTGTAADITLAAPVTTINSLIQSTDGGTSPAAIDTAGQTLRLGAVAGILTQAGAGTLTIGTGLPANVGILTAGGADDTAGEIAVISNAAMTVNSAITNNGSGAVTLTKDGASTLTLAGTNTYSGLTTVANGILELANGSAIADSGAVTLANSAGVILKLSASETIGALSGGGTTGGNIDLQGNALTAGDATNTAFDGVIGGTLGSLVKSGTGSLTLTNTNTYTGGTVISQGTLVLSKVDAATAAGTITLGDAGTGANATTLSANVASGTFANPIVVSASGSGTASIISNLNFVTYTGAMTLNRATTLGGTAGDRYGYTGKISGAAGTLTIDAPRVVFAQTVDNTNDFTGNVVINAAKVLQVATTYGLSAVNSVTANGTLRVIGSAASAVVTIDALNGTGAVNGDTGGGNYLKTLSMGGNDGSGSFSGTITNGSGSDTLALIKTGAGTQVLTGPGAIPTSNSTYSGNVLIEEGKLIAGAVHGTGTNTVLGNASTARTVTVSAGATLEFAAPNVLGGHNAGSAPTIIVDGGTLTNSDPASSTVVNNGLTNLTLNSGTLTSTTSNITPNDIDGTARPNDYYGAWGINGTLTSTGTSQITTTDASVGAGRVLLRSTATAGQDTVFDVTGTLTVGVILQGGDSDAGGLNKTNTGKLVINSASTYRGPTTVTAGILELNGSLVKSAPAEPPSAITVVSGATLAGTGTAEGTVTANGAVAPGSSGIGTLSAATASFNSTGSLVAEISSTIAAGTPATAADKLVITGDLNIAADAALNLTDLGSTVLSTAAKLVLVKYTGTWTGAVPFFGKADDSTVTVGVNTYTINYNDTDGGINAVTLTAVPVVTDPFAGWASGYGLVGPAAAKDADPDGDDSNNLLEFATAGDPTSASSGPRCYPLMFTIGADNALTYTVAVRKDVTAGFVPAASPNEEQQTAIKDLVIYTVEGTDDLTTWNLVPVSEVTGGDATAVQTALGTKLTTPALDTVNYEWHTFRTDGGTALDPSDFIRLKVAEAAP